MKHVKPRWRPLSRARELSPRGRHQARSSLARAVAKLKYPLDGQQFIRLTNGQPFTFNGTTWGLCSANGLMFGYRWFASEAHGKDGVHEQPVALRPGNLVVANNTLFRVAQRRSGEPEFVLEVGRYKLTFRGRLATLDEPPIVVLVVARTAQEAMEWLWDRLGYQCNVMTTRMPDA